MLEHLAELARTATSDRSEFALSEEGSSLTRRRFVLKIHTFRIAAINIGLEGRTVTVWGEQIERGRGSLSNPQHRSAEYGEVDEAWMKTFQVVFSQIE